LPRSRSKTRFLLALLALTALLACGLTSAAAAKKPHRPSFYWGAWIGSQLTGSQPPWDMSAVSAFESLVGKSPSLLQFSAPFMDCNGPGECSPHPFPAAEMTSIREYGAIPVFSWGSQGGSETLEQPAFSLARLAEGGEDAYVREFAEAAKQWGHPFFLRFDWEMNGNWFPWGTGISGNTTSQFVAAWRHIHDIFTVVGATNATWVWCPYADPGGHLAKLKGFYPGKNYVDWTCIDGYNWAKNTVNPSPWRTFDQIFTETYAKVASMAPHKPIMLGEVASNGTGRRKAKWYREMFKALDGKAFPKVRALVYFDQYDRDLRWPLEVSSASAKAFARGVHPRKFKPARYSSISERPILPPR
jgi:hypothetical protein